MGNIKEAKILLDELCTSGKINSYLYQEVSKNSEVREDRRSLVPYHLRLNFENIESVYLVSVILLEVPYLVSGNYDESSVNKLFLKLW